MAKSLVSVTHMGSKTLKMARDYGLAAFMGGAGVMHFVNPGFFEAVVPGWFPVDNSTTVAVSGRLPAEYQFTACEALGV